MCSAVRQMSARLRCASSYVTASSPHMLFCRRMPHRPRASVSAIAGRTAVSPRRTADQRSAEEGRAECRRRRTCGCAVVIAASGKGKPAHCWPAGLGGRRPALGPSAVPDPFARGVRTASGEWPLLPGPGRVRIVRSATSGAGTVDTRPEGTATAEVCARAGGARTVACWPGRVRQPEGRRNRRRRRPGVPVLAGQGATA
jgi:hypothetical protein